jgi:thiosulfate dehydrogenase
MKKEGNDPFMQSMLITIQQLITAVSVLFVGLILMTITFVYNEDIAEYVHRLTTPNPKVDPKEAVILASSVESFYWVAPNLAELKDQKKRVQINYGKQLIAHTAKYLGPKGSVAAISNGMNCQNCHLDAGTKIFGNNYGSVASTYPKFRARSGMEEDIYKRVNDCFERSLNGQGLEPRSKEMQAIKAYIEFLGMDVPKGEKAEGSGLKELAYLDRAADPAKGKLVYVDKCQSCHQPNGGGLLNTVRTEYTYPPLWGKNSYNDGAGLYRVSNFAKYAKYNMPLGVNHSFPQLSDEEAWDVAAFVNSKSRPHKDVPKDWPDIAKKPIDHPFGPYADGFSEQQHKFGPFQPIATQKN